MHWHNQRVCPLSRLGSQRHTCGIPKYNITEFHVEALLLNVLGFYPTCLSFYFEYNNTLIWVSDAGLPSLVMMSWNDLKELIVTNIKFQHLLTLIMWRYCLFIFFSHFFNILGWLTTNVKLPTLSESFHYRIEGTVPALTYAYEGEVSSVL